MEKLFIENLKILMKQKHQKKVIIIIVEVNLIAYKKMNLLKKVHYLYF